MTDEDFRTLHNAIGILMARDGLTADEAFTFIMEEGGHAHMTPGDLAYEIVLQQDNERGER